MTRTLEHRHNNAYDSILLVEDGEVIGAWTVGERGDELDNFHAAGDLSDWEPTHPENTKPEDYGDLVATVIDGVPVEDIGDGFFESADGTVIHE